MAKFRITSIPASLPKAQQGGEKKSRLRNFLFGQEGNAPIQQSISTPMVPVDGQEQFDIFQPRTEQEIANTLPTVWTQGTTVPSYEYQYKSPDSYMYNPVTLNAYQKSLEKQLGLPYSGPGGKFSEKSVTIPERFVPDYSLGEDGQPLQCPQGKYPYKGQCFSEEMYIKLRKEEMDNEQYTFDAKRKESQEAFQDKLNTVRKQNEEQAQRVRNKEIEGYYEKFKNSKKSDKIEPYMSVPSYDYNLNAKIPVLDEEGNQIIDKETGKPQFRTQRDILQESFLVIENKEKGTVDVYPKDIVYDRIINNGFQAEQFKNYWGVDAKQVKSQVGDIMKQAKAQYDATVQQKILQKALDEGKPVSEIIKTLPKSLITQAGAQSFVKPTQKLIDDALKNVQNSLSLEPGTDRSKVNQDRDVFTSDDPVAAWEKKYHPNMLGDSYWTQKFEKGEKAYNEWMDKYGDVGTYDNLTFAKDDRMADVRNQNVLRNQAITRNAAFNAKESAEAEDFNKAYGAYLQNLSSDLSKQVLSNAITNLDEKGKLKLLKEIQADPDQAFQNLLNTKSGTDNKTYADLINEGTELAFGFEKSGPRITQGKANQFNIDESTGAKVKDVLKHPFDALYYLANEREGMWDGPKNLTYSQRKQIEDEKGIDLGTMPVSVMSPFNFLLQPLNPFKIGFNLREGYDKGEFASALGEELWDVGSTYGGIKGLNAMKGVTNLRPLAKNMLNNPFVDAAGLAYSKQFFDQAQQNFDQGNYLDAALDTGIGTLSALPAYRSLQNLTRYTSPGMSLQNLYKSQPAVKILDERYTPPIKGLLGMKKGGVAMQLSKKEIDKYVADGYIVEEE